MCPCASGQGGRAQGSLSVPHTARSVPSAARLSRARGPFPSRPESHHYAALVRAKQPSPNTSPEPLHCRQGNTPQ